jgi:hypothetical protein
MGKASAKNSAASIMTIERGASRGVGLTAKREGVCRAKGTA